MCGAKVIFSPRAWLCPGSLTATPTMSPSSTAMRQTRLQLGSQSHHVAGSVQLEATNNLEEHNWRMARTANQLASSVMVALVAAASPTLGRRSLAAARAARRSLLRRYAVTSETVEKVETPAKTVGESEPGKPGKEGVEDEEIE